MRESATTNEQQTYEVKNLIEDVRVILDMNDTSRQFVSVADKETLTIDEIIRSKITDAARYIIMAAPYYLVGNGNSFASSIGWTSGTKYSWGFTKLPADFLRLVSFQMADWSYPVHIPIGENDEEYKYQHSEFGGIGGNPERPVVALVEYPTGLCLEFFKCKEAQTAVKRARYIPMPNITEDNESGEEVVSLPSKLLQAIEYYAAYLTGLTIADQNAQNYAVIALQSADIQPQQTTEENAQ